MTLVGRFNITVHVLLHCNTTRPVGLFATPKGASVHRISFFLSTAKFAKRTSSHHHPRWHLRSYPPLAAMSLAINILFSPISAFTSSISSWTKCFFSMPALRRSCMIVDRRTEELRESLKQCVFYDIHLFMNQ